MNPERVKVASIATNNRAFLIVYMIYNSRWTVQSSNPIIY